MQAQIGRPKDLIKKQRIVDSAKALFLSHGYQGSSMQKIAAHAGVSKLTLYSHFEDKAHLFTYAVSDTCEQLLNSEFIQLKYPDDFLQQFQQMACMSLSVVYLPEAMKLDYLLLTLAAEKNPLSVQFYAASHGKMRHMWSEFFQQAMQLNCLKTQATEDYVNLWNMLLMGARHHEVLLTVRAVPNVEEQKKIAQCAIQQFLSLNHL